MQLPVLADNENQFSCGGCGDCCSQPYRVLIDAERARAIERHDWAAYPQLAGKTLLRPAMDGAAGYFDVAKGDHWRCAFLDAGNRCLIHAELGAAAKPAMCQHFPFLSSTTWTSSRVSMSFACPSVQAGRGAPLVEQLSQIETMLPATAQQQDFDALVPLDGVHRITQPELNALIDHMLAIFDDAADGDLWFRFARVLTLLSATAQHSAQATCNTPPLIEWLKAGDDAPGLNDPPRVTAFDNPLAAPGPSRILFAATLLPDTAPANAAARMSFFRRMTMIPRLMSLARLSGGYASRLLGWNVSIDAVRRHGGVAPLDAAATRLLLRYFRARLWQRLIIGTRLSVVAGVHQHIHDFNAIIFFARALAQHEGASQPTHTHVGQALALVEFHMANQPRLYHQTLTGWLTAMLNSPSLAFASLRLMSPHSAPAAPDMAATSTPAAGGRVN